MLLAHTTLNVLCGEFISNVSLQGLYILTIRMKVMDWITIEQKIRNGCKTHRKSIEYTQKYIAYSKN